METKINQAIKSVLLMFGEKYFIDEIINKQKVIQDLDNYDKELMAKMLSNDIVKKIILRWLLMMPLFLM